jgi:segregation and condensation protein B
MAVVHSRVVAGRLPAGAPVEDLLQVLEDQYAGRGVNVVRIAGKIGLRTAPDLAGALDIEMPVTRKLSRAAVETLAIVAYQHAERKPVTRAEIEEIRGVSISKGTLDQLMEAGWIKPHGYRENVPGRPAEWVTTDEQATRLRILGCDALQGHRIGEPVPADEFARSVRGARR